MDTASPIQDAPFESPILTPLADQMAVDLVVNEQGQVWVLHDKRFPDFLSGVEYHEDSNQLYFMTQKGDMIELGMKIPQTMCEPLMKADQICLLRMNGKAVEDMYILRLVVQRTLVY